jgi:3-oxoacyl-[acyl-carrier protein] reductase
MSKKVLVTGSTRGIGRGIIEKFHSENWDVCITGRDEDQVKNLQYGFNQVRENSAIGICVDLEEKSEAIRLFEHVDKVWGTLDCLVFNIGNGNGPKGIDSDFPSNTELAKINFLDAVWNFYKLIPLLESNKDGGSLVFIGSIAQETNVKAPISYAYSKKAVNTFAKYQARRLAPKGITCNAINPGHILTNNGVWGKKKEDSPELFDDFVSKNIPVGNIGEVENVAELVFFCTNKRLSRYFTGESLTIDGGTSILY